MANLTTKELAAIEDQLTVEQNLIQKYKAYALHRSAVENEMRANRRQTPKPFSEIDGATELNK